MAEFAEQAVESAKFWRKDLDYTAESLEAVDDLMECIFRMNRNQSLPENVLQGVANLYGAYLGEVLLRSGLKDLGYAWTEDEEGGIGIGRGDICIWMAPVTKVYKRITRGSEHSIMDFFEIMFGRAIGAVDPNDPRMHTLGKEAV